MVILYNHSDTDYLVKKGDKVAQLICERCILPNIKVVEGDPTSSSSSSSANPSPSPSPEAGAGATERGARGFGSSGY